LWNDESFTIEIREKTSFYRIISNWIVNFELRSGKLDTLQHPFELVLNFMHKETRTMLERLVMMEEIYEDLKELIAGSFWEEEREISMDPVSPGKFKNQLPNSQASTVSILKRESLTEAQLCEVQTVLALVEAILNPLYYRVHPKSILYRNCTYGELNLPNVRAFIKKCLYYLLRSSMLPTHIQTQLTKLSLNYMQFLAVEDSSEILNLVRHLMLRTSKAVRFALVIEYV
jgi:hypothetical protein